MSKKAAGRACVSIALSFPIRVDPVSRRCSGFYLYSLPVMNLTSKLRVRALLVLGELHYDLRYSSM
jgi:hypothetical protein